MSDFYLIYKNMTRKPLRLFLTCFAISIAFLIFGAVSTLKGALDSRVELSAENRLLVFSKLNFSVPLPIAHFQKVKAIEGVKDITHITWFGAYYQDPIEQVGAFAVDPESYLKVYDELEVDSKQRLSWLGNRQGILVGKKLADRYGWKPGDRIPISSNIYSHRNEGNTWDFVVEGIFNASDERTDTGKALFHYKYLQETASFDGDSVSRLSLTTKSSSLNDKVSKSIDDIFSNSPYETKTSSENAFYKEYFDQVGNIGLIIFGVVSMAFLTILMVVGSTMALAIRERTGEIAVLKTIGFSSIRVFKIVLSESLLISILGGASGLLGAYCLILGVSANWGSSLPGLVMRPETLLQATSYMLLLGLITGLIPALNALRLNIVSAFNIAS
ncbi:ABC transporter permease [Microbulbifer sp. A4B17]|uniref:ABC transporter permease n=1 Tax=Microbulbifer sp. A4B17 TaxID=359370 RepID=UPI000D52BF54|nr:FtsX-like permease family protein [Microbulbifer sp. A4B17]AWF80213.1 ABC transporter permease [Microbulbifer sp. A4B17]